MKKLLLISLMIFTVTAGAQDNSGTSTKRKSFCTLLMLAFARMTGTAADYPVCEKQGIALPGSEWGGGHGARICLGIGYDEPEWVCGEAYRVYQHVGSSDFWLSENMNMRCGQKGSCPPLSSQAARLKTGSYKNAYNGHQYKIDGVARDHASCKEYALYDGPGCKGLCAMPLDTFTKNVTKCQSYSKRRPPSYSISCDSYKEIPLFEYRGQE